MPSRGQVFRGGRPIDFSAAKASVSITDVLGLVGFKPLRKKGPQQRGPCPVHGSKSATSKIFSVNTERGAYQCFSCGSKGDQLKLYAEVTGLPVYEATVELFGKLGKKLPLKPKG